MKIEKRLMPKKLGVTNEAFEPLTIGLIDSEDSGYGQVIASDGAGGTWWMNTVNPPIDVTYAELVTAINGSDLVVGQSYRITDFATTHYIVDSAKTVYNAGDGIIVGANEPLIVLAIATNKIHAEVKSASFPQDVIYYDWNPANWLADLSFSANGVNIISGWKGVILSRHDTSLDIKAPGDWRNCKTRRWDTDTDAWDNGTTYDSGDIVSYAATSKVYMSIFGSNLNKVPTNNEWWIALLDLTTYVYWNTAPAGLTIPSGANYADFLLFNGGTGGVGAIHIGSNDTTEFETILPNSVFFDTSYIKSNNIGTSFCYNTFNGTGFLHNIIGEHCAYNIVAGSTYVGYGFTRNNIGPHFNNNIIDTDCSDNTTGSYFYQNAIGTFFSSNMIGSSFYKNKIGDFFGYNLTVSYFQENKVGENMTGNALKDNCVLNTMGKDFKANSIGYSFMSNTIGNSFMRNLIGAYFNSNTIVNNFQMNQVYDAACVSINFTGASHVYGAYTCEIYKRLDGTAKLRYTDNADAIVVVAPTA